MDKKDLLKKLEDLYNIRELKDSKRLNQDIRKSVLDFHFICTSYFLGYIELFI